MKSRNSLQCAGRVALCLAIVAAVCPAQAKQAAEPADQEAPAVIIPADLEPKLQALAKEKREFVTSGKAGRFMSTRALLERFRASTPQDIEAMIDAMIAVVEESKYHAGTDAAAIPLDTTVQNFNGWKAKRPLNLDPKREPGPIHLSRYVSGRAAGIPTFASAPVAVTPEDLRAGKVDIAIVGAPIDMGSGFRGARGGPLALRTTRGAVGNDMNTMVDPSDELNIADYGDIAIDYMSAERTVAHVRDEVRQIAETGAIPFVVGGDHSLEYPDVAAITDVYGKGKVGVVHFDAHYDAGTGFTAHLLTHGSPVYRLVKEGHVPGKNYIQVGLHGLYPDADAFHWMREQGFRYHTMAEVEQKGWETVMRTAVREAREGPKYLYISFDVDVLDPAFMPGTGSPEAGGLMMREALPIVRRLCAETNVVGFEIVEIDPLLDPSYKTALNSNYIMHACLTGIAMHRKGITQEHFLSPLATEHAQPER